MAKKAKSKPKLRTLAEQFGRDPDFQRHGKGGAVPRKASKSKAKPCVCVTG